MIMVTAKMENVYVQRDGLIFREEIHVKKLYVQELQIAQDMVFVLRAEKERTSVIAKILGQSNLFVRRNLVLMIAQVEVLVTMVLVHVTMGSGEFHVETWNVRRTNLGLKEILVVQDMVHVNRAEYVTARMDFVVIRVRSVHV